MLHVRGCPVVYAHHQVAKQSALQHRRVSRSGAVRLGVAPLCSLLNSHTSPAHHPLVSTDTSDIIHGLIVYNFVSTDMTDARLNSALCQLACKRVSLCVQDCTLNTIDLSFYGLRVLTHIHILYHLHAIKVLTICTQCTTCNLV